jgi:hypothetical protein
VLAWPIDRVVIAHGPLLTAGAAALVRRAFAWLVGRYPDAEHSPPKSRGD